MLQYTTKKKVELIKRLEQYRLDNKISQDKLAELLHVHRITLNHWLTGRRKPNKIQTHHIKKFLEEKNK